MNSSSARKSSQQSISNYAPSFKNIKIYIEENNTQGSFNSLYKGSFNNLKSMQELEYYPRKTNGYFYGSFLNKNMANQSPRKYKEVSKSKEIASEIINKSSLIKNKVLNELPSTTKSRNFIQNLKHSGNQNNLKF